MDLFEYQGKQYFARFDIPVSPGDVAYTVDEAVAAAEEPKKDESKKDKKKDKKVKA